MVQCFKNTSAHTIPKKKKKNDSVGCKILPYFKPNIIPKKKVLWAVKSFYISSPIQLPSKLSSLYSFFHFTLKPSVRAVTPPPPRLNPPCQRNGEHYNTVTVTHTTPSFSQTRTPSLYSQLSKPTHRRNSTLN